MRDVQKAWLYFGLAAWPSLAASALFTAARLDWRIVLLCIGNAIYHGLMALKALNSNPNMPALEDFRIERRD